MLKACLLTTLLLHQTLQADQFRYILDNAEGSQRVQRIKTLCYSQFPQYERKLVDYFIDQAEGNN